ncbi:MAG: hypothetical protein E7049_12170 [Lentisphaerae bacterium]|nr:hypothetical protein [Lentisphaerota bacterium]
MKTATNAIVLLVSICLGAFTSLGDITTGWNKTEKGAYDFLSTDNWADGVVSGVFSADWASGSGGDTDLYLGSDWTGSFKIFGSIVGRTIIRASNGPCTVTLNDDLYLTPSSMGQDFVFGNGYDDKKKLNFDLGGQSRKIFINGGARWIFSDRISNGDLAFDGAGTVTFRSAGGSNGAITLSTNTVLKTGFTSSDKNDIDAVRASDLTLSRSRVEFQETYVSVIDRITGKLKVLADEPSCSILYPRASTADKTDTVRIGSLDMEPGSSLLVRGAKLGGDVKVLFDTAPDTIGGIVPQLVGAKADGDTAGQNGMYDQSFVSYDAENGLVPLDLTTDYAADVSAETSVNLLIPYGTTNYLSGPATVNSLYLGAKNGGDQCAAIMPGENVEDATLTVESGMVLIGYNSAAGNYKYPTVGVPLDFGARPGFIVCPGGKRNQINGALKGSAGVTFTTPMATSAAITTSGLVFGGDANESTYTGDTYIQTFVNVGATGLLPHGDRTGDVYVNGILLADNFTINGLYGKGTVNRASSGTKNMFVGDNDADGDFTGTFSVTDNSSTLTKIGTGMQRFGGMVTLASNGNFNVNVGKVVLDGTVTQGAVNVAAGAAIGGNGSIATTLTFVDGAKFDVDVADDVASCLNVTGAVTGGPVTVNANVRSGKWRTAQRILTSGTSMGEMTFAKGAGVGALELRENGTELWATPRKAGFYVVIQ